MKQIIPIFGNPSKENPIKVKVGNYIYKGDIVGNNKGKIKRFIHSSVSGKLKITSAGNNPHIQFSLDNSNFNNRFFFIKTC